MATVTHPARPAAHADDGAALRLWRGRDVDELNAGDGDRDEFAAALTRWRDTDVDELEVELRGKGGWWP